MEDIRYVVNENSVELYLPTKNKGKFRWKNRIDNSKYGEGFATRQIPFVEESYIEWQIGYDSVVNDPKKTTILTDLEFVGANGRTKNPYELSEIIFLMKQSGLVSDEDLRQLREEIRHRNFSFDEQYTIETNERELVRIADFDFHRQDITLPTFSDYETDRGLSIEISIQKQQYATGIQPMVYFVIPVSCFDNYRDMLGSTSQEVDEAKWTINQENMHFILNLFKYFGICSSNHKHDVLSILEILIGN